MTTKTKTTTRRPLTLLVSLFNSSKTDYPLHDVWIKRDADESPTGGYVTKRDANGTATNGPGLWWVGICWSPDAEHGPYPTLTAACKAVETEQILTPTLRSAGWKS